MRDQGDQIKALRELNKELQARGAEQEKVRKLFLKTKGLRYTCVIPVEYRRKPLPNIMAGDYYAWHVIQNFVGDIEVEMHLTNRVVKRGTSAGVPDGSIIFLCSPQANPVLDKIAPWLNVNGTHIMARSDDQRRDSGANLIGASEATERSTQSLKPSGIERLGKLQLPIWFGNRKSLISKEESGKVVVRGQGGQDGKWDEWDEKVILHLPTSNGGGSGLSKTVDVRTSPADASYVAAARLQDDQELDANDRRKLKVTSR